MKHLKSRVSPPLQRGILTTRDLRRLPRNKSASSHLLRPKRGRLPITEGLQDLTQRPKRNHLQGKAGKQTRKATRQGLLKAVFLREKRNLRRHQKLKETAPRIKLPLLAKGSSLRVREASSRAPCPR